MARCVLARAQPSKFYYGTREDDVRQQQAVFLVSNISV